MGFIRSKSEIVEELKHLIGYFQQAAHEFFDETSSELIERLDVLHGRLEEGKNSLEEYRKMIAALTSYHADLKKKVEDLGFLTDRMGRLFEE